jgi:hypothetical protein
MNAGTTKLSTVHSFKGWEINHLVLVLDRPNWQENPELRKTQLDELVYTGLTRCKRNLFILNFGHDSYHQFFTNYINRR